MNCNCRWVETILGLAILVFTWWMVSWGKWVVTIAAAMIILHALMCKNCGACSNDVKMAPTKTAVKKKKK